MHDKKGLVSFGKSIELMSVNHDPNKKLTYAEYWSVN